jgi:hypothetical protein
MQDAANKSAIVIAPPEVTVMLVNGKIQNQIERNNTYIYMLHARVKNV